jgi:hypothetical protein
VGARARCNYRKVQRHRFSGAKLKQNQRIALLGFNFSFITQFQKTKNKKQKRGHTRTEKHVHIQKQKTQTQHNMAGKINTTSAWAQPTDLEADFRSWVASGNKTSRDAFDSYQDFRNMEGAHDTSNFWQAESCNRDGFQAHEHGKTQPNVYCKSLTPSVAGWERQQQIMDAAVERQLDLPPSVLAALGNGLDVDEAYAQSGVALPFANLTVPMPTQFRAVRAATSMRGHSMRAIAGASLGMSGAHTNSLSVGAAYAGGRVLSTIEMPGTPAFSTNSPANMPEPGKSAPASKGAIVYTRQHESGSGKTTYATTYLGGGGAAGAYSQPAAGASLSSVFRGQTTQ